MKSPWETSPRFLHQNVRKGLVKRTKKGRDLDGVESHFISETEGIRQSPGMRVQERTEKG
jgi:hypothetical protein